MQMTEVRSEETQKRNLSRIRWGFRLAIAACALLDCWIGRFRMNPDGVSYLDMGDLFWKRDWHAAFTAIWSPLYGWLTGFVLLLTKPELRWEYPVVHLLNFVILVATLFCFEFFWRELLTFKDGESWMGPHSAHAWVLGYLLFAYVHLAVHRLLLVTPDLLVSALVYLAFGLMLRYAGGRLSTSAAFLLGAILGLGYLAKTAMLPFSFVFLLTMLAVAWRQHKRKRLIAAALLSLLVTSLPYMAALSWNMHRLTFGDTAKINQGWFVNGVTPPCRHWQGSQPGHKDALHPTRKIYDWPEVYEFSTPIAGTYPVSYDASYWYAGLDSGIHPAREIRIIVKNCIFVLPAVFLTSGFLVVVALMFYLGGRVKDSWRDWMSLWPLLVPAGAAFLMYMTMYWEARYTSGAMLVMWGAAMVSTNIASEERKTKVFWTAALLLGVLIAGRFSMVLVEDFRDEKHRERIVTVAEDLRAAGVEPGSPIALIGDGNIAPGWARLAKLRIIAEVPYRFDTGDSATAFWYATPQTETAVLHLLKGTQAKAVVADPAPALLPPGWLTLGNTGSAVYFFPE
jgi:hypothetical protein